jgi:hypothetical protein
MSFIQRELDRIGIALRKSDPVPQYDQLYLAQQSLMWATDPNIYKSPFDLVADSIPAGDGIEAGGVYQTPPE